MKKIAIIVGARPNFVKASPLVKQLKKIKIFDILLIHTGQHYDSNMSKIFFKDLGLPAPDVFLGIGGGTHTEQTAKIMIELEKKLTNYSPDLVVVVGDVNSTLAGAIVSKKLNIKLAHIEAGLRS
ncbi:MAG TPA: UDP-N-acetylglucosamine 2-epimerase, partial [bacterium]|nr:UDP-N-acetylglucosamine 2-epimerase [bacterium]